MNSSLYIGATGMKTLGSGMNVISNNIANVSTIGYKEQTALFSDVFYAQQGSIGDWWDAQTNSKVARPSVGQGGSMPCSHGLARALLSLPIPLRIWPSAARASFR